VNLQFQLLQNLAEAGVTVVVVAHEAEKDLVWADKVLKLPFQLEKTGHSFKL